MITAKNYAAQALKSLNRFILNSELLNKYGVDLSSAKLISSKINQAVHFAIPDGGKIFDSGFKGLRGQDINLPYPVITIEFLASVADIGDDNEKIVVNEKTVVVAWQDEKNSDIYTVSLTNYEKNKHWLRGPYGLKVPYDLHNNGNPLERTVEYIGMFPETASNLTTTQQEMFTKASFCDLSMHELLEALSCKNVEQSIHQPASPKNAQRLKPHKLPIYETRFLTIKAGKDKAESNKSDVKGNHASPRQHLRRGHIRRLEAGNIWVNSCVVGDANKGIINKNYMVIPA